MIVRLNQFPFVGSKPFPFIEQLSLLLLNSNVRAFHHLLNSKPDFLSSFTTINSSIDVFRKTEKNGLNSLIISFNLLKFSFRQFIICLLMKREAKKVPNIVRASNRTKPITVSQPPIISKKDVNSDLNDLSSTGIDNTKTRRPQPRSNTKNDRKQKVKVSIKEIQKKYQPKVSKPKKVGSSESLATPKPRKYRLLLRWSPTGKLFDKEGNLKLLINFVWKFMGTVRFGNDHVAAILGFGDLQWGNILITRVYFVEGLGHNLFSVGQFCDSDLEVAFRRDACFVRNLEGVDLLKGDHSTNLYTINLHEMATASPICLMARASSTKSCINGKRYVLVIVDDYSRYTWVHFLRSKDEAPEVIIKFLKRITVLLQSPVIIIRTDNGTEFKNQVLREYFDTIGISHQMSSVRTQQQNEVVERQNRMLVEAAKTMLIFSRAPLFLWAEAIATACFTQNRSIRAD
nr:integrase, catalytic region, zinc finger, CCHC-type, peptidase aspartic, catalytic [Tanacetum cinerariifolium]